MATPDNKNTVSFSVDAALIDRLGRELVQKKETAVAELVKNAYDADATEVTLIFEDTDSSGGVLKIKDDGHGMDYDRFVDAFMRISSSDKINNPISPRFKRQKAGRKGIGRFSAQTLGSKLTLITKTKDQQKALRITINWDDYQREKDLNSISHIFDFIDISDEEGTLMIIENLREKWTDAQIKRVYRYVSDLIQPQPLSKQRSKGDDPGFKANFYKVIDGEPVGVLDEEAFIYNYAVAKIEGEVNKKGVAKWSLRSNKLGIKELNKEIGPDEENGTNTFEVLKDISFEVYYFIYRQDLIPTQHQSVIRNLANEKGGVRVYKNGFKVSPYGEPGDDWLLLDEAARRRSITAPIGNLQFFGHVDIIDIESEFFKETSSREGFIRNKAFEELSSLLHRIIIATVLRIASERGRKGSAGQSDWEKKSSKEKLDETSEKLNQLAEEIEKSTTQTGSASGESKKQADQARRLASEVRQARDKLDEELGEQEMLRVLASLGLIIGEFTHEIKHFLDGLKYQSQQIIDLAEGIPDLKNISIKFLKDFKGLESYTSYFDSNVSEQVNRDRRPIEIQEVINEFQENITRDLNRSNIDLTIERDGKAMFTRAMHGSEWASIVYNLYSNSKKAIGRANVNGKIKIKVGKNDTNVYMIFSDNGDGIPEVNKEKVFDAFFTTSTPTGPNAKDNDDILGSGLGLKIIRDIINGYNGTIEVIKPIKGYSTSFKITVPKATKEEYAPYAL